LAYFVIKGCHGYSKEGICGDFPQNGEKNERKGKESR
jgi:hypothetical protein